ncbi:hypothetical protein FRC02_009543 [Tulasnella sp. 418]|nr:hypothetical protein FRC02_009543 [Tulasnella sp. 418]
MSPHPALTLVEILDAIFTFADYQSRTVAARTCRKWQEPATNTIWRNLDSLLPLLQLLSPVIWGPYQGDFAEETRPGGWTAFIRASSRVRSVKHEDSSPAPRTSANGGRYLSKDVFIRLALQRPHRELLPNLVEIEWLDSRSEALDFVPMFISSRTEKVTIAMGEMVAPPTEQIRFLIRHLPLFTRVLTNFTLSTVLEASMVQSELVYMIGEMESLKKIMLPRHYHTKEITEALGTHPSIDCILHSVDWDAHPSYEDIGNKFTFEAGWFINLRRLSLDTKLGDVIELIRNPSRPPKLYSLKVSALRIPIDMEELRTLLRELPQVYPNLTRLLFDLFHSQINVQEDNLSMAQARIPFDVLRPLLSCSQMQTFRLGHNHPLDVTEADVLELTHQWPKLVNLYFGEDPVITANMAPGLPMKVLAHFAANCRRLQIIHLYLDTSTWKSFEASIPRPIPIFSSTLEWICFGTSVAADDYEIAVILSEMCDHGPVEIGYGRGPFNLASQGHLADDPRNSIMMWAEVNRQFKTLYRYRKTLEARLKELEDGNGTTVSGIDAEVAALSLESHEIET